MRGMRSRRLASETSENAPVMRACEAMIAASVERMTPPGRIIEGSIWKKGLRSEIEASASLPCSASSQAPWPR